VVRHPPHGGDLPWLGDRASEPSDQDEAAPTLTEAKEQGLLPTMEQRAARYAEPPTGA
jgi:dTDP-4-dehydrorhamnose 3,5-epimerase